MQLDSMDGLRAALDRVNRGRLGLAPADEGDAIAAAEREIEHRYRPSVQLAIYGTLAPGEVNHHHIADLGGAWQAGAVRGTLGQVEHGVHRGLPGIRLDPAAPPHPVKLLVNEALPGAWARLDAFEGEEMQRLLVVLDDAGGIAGVANIYALRRAMLQALG